VGTVLKPNNLQVDNDVNASFVAEETYVSTVWCRSLLVVQYILTYLKRLIDRNKMPTVYTVTRSSIEEHQVSDLSAVKRVLVGGGNGSDVGEWRRPHQQLL